jgi:hypothetical protein
MEMSTVKPQCIIFEGGGKIKMINTGKRQLWESIKNEKKTKKLK